ncbi:MULTISPECIES: helix-turn-helix domain-containing protein [Pseudomonadota]|uniref:XRE family transcriptional regulator n=2 Tax=Pseudomonadota TaxID=1224 RepID=A0A2M8RTY4_9PAST|nr:MULTISPECIES: helix-turn-helix transcriptional regulator [Pseudomonadota]PJG82324.1 XRE family transcriptional regulator [Caviibacterium pharyngocola]QEY24544.1 XRE family transcriptional regulator [Neisseria animalis]ROW33039.1 XRE family transcriptional regulator [Neisseria animalis]VEE07329.1 Predicted transcriptional regulator with an HTH domain [Neisseria animalis]
MNISKRLNQLIELKQLNIKDFAEQCDIPYRSMYNYVRGEREPNLEALSKISQTFNVDLNWLISWEGEIFKGVPKDAFSDEENQLITYYRLMPGIVQNAMKVAFKAISTE